MGDDTLSDLGDAPDTHNATALSCPAKMFLSWLRFLASLVPEICEISVANLSCVKCAFFVSE